MLEIRISCENCDKSLPNGSSEAMICTYECTFCSDCVDNVLKNVCPNCVEALKKRPTRPKTELKKYPAREDKIYKPVQENSFLKKNINIDPRER